MGSSQQSGALVAAAPSLTVAATPEELTEITDEIAEDRTAFEAELDALTLREDDDVRSSAIREIGNALIPNIEAINDTVLTRFEVIDLREERRVELASLRDELTGILVPAIDDQLFFAMTGYRDLGEPPAPRAEHLSEEELNRYRFLAELKADADSWNATSCHRIQYFGRSLARAGTGAFRGDGQRYRTASRGAWRDAVAR